MKRNHQLIILDNICLNVPYNMIPEYDEILDLYNITLLVDIMILDEFKDIQFNECLIVEITFISNNLQC